MYVNVLVQVNIIDEKLFTYFVPLHLENKVKIGVRVKVEFNARIIEGFLMEKTDKKEGFEIKEIIDILDDEPLLNKELFQLGKFMSEYYLEPLNNCYKVMLPKVLTKTYNLKNIKEEKYDIYNKVKLTEKQNEVYNKIKNSKESLYLLRGITGSGKTEIYMNLIEDIINAGKTAIFLVPEISVTIQLLNRFKKRFKDKVAVIHSKLTPKQRYYEYQKIKNGMSNIVIGARSAIFAPLSNIGLIIIDEEHDYSYKQEQSPKYTTLDIAIERTKYHNAKLVLGSATPSLESYARAKTNKYKLVELTERINKKQLPKVEIINMMVQMKKGNQILSDVAHDKIKDTLHKKEQIMILYNRRGYSNYIICNDCGEVIRCPNCDISLTYHKTPNLMKCHYCEYSIGKPEKCPSCNSKYIMPMGSGTEKIEEYLLNKFENVRLIRMDRDTTTKKDSHEKIINAFNNNEYDILLGTQMIAKGLDFKNVTLVLVLNGDNSLNIPDYRSSERTFQLITQVSGRAGRSNKEGEVIVQTYNYNHYSILYAKQHDYLGFYNREMFIRKKLNYPPFTFLVTIKKTTNNYSKGEEIINKVYHYLKNNLKENNVVLGPSSSLKINNKYTFQCLIKYRDRKEVTDVLKDILNHYKTKNIKLDVDFNPIRTL